MNHNRIILIALLLVVGILGGEMLFNARVVTASPGIFSTWSATYPNSSSGALSCQACHQGPGGGDGWNAYGWSIRQKIIDENLGTADAIRAVEALDADGNGQTNLAEVSGNAQPGWTTGAANTIFFKDGTTRTAQSPPSGSNLLDLADMEDALSIKLTTYADGLLSPIMGTATPSLPDDLFVVDQTGQVWRINLQDGTRSIFLDMSLQLINRGEFKGYDERGLLGFAMHPDYATNGLIYTHSSEPVAGTADFSTMPANKQANHHGIVAQWQVKSPTNPASVVDRTTKQELLRIDQPQFNHNGGVLAFGSDNMLYIGLGDGGGADDQGAEGHGENGNGQDLTNPLGTILRIDPLGDNSANGRYGIPEDNPFVGEEDIVPEIFAYGLRNPYSFSFDSVTGDLYVGDVGQNDIEEVNIIDPGNNYGWPLKEGSLFFDQNGANDGFATDEEPETFPGDLLDDLIDPIAEYNHDKGKSVIGGFVYRGTAIPELQGHYVFGDWGSKFETPSGSLFYLAEDNTITDLTIVDQNQLNVFITGFGQDAAGELYLLGNTTATPTQDETDAKTGVVMRISNSTSTDEIQIRSRRYEIYMPTISR